MQSVVGRILSDVVNLYLFILFVRVILEYVLQFNRSFRPSGGAALLFEVVFSLTDPPLKALRRIIPPLRIGNASIDLGFILLFVVLIIIRGTLLSRI